MVSDDFRLSRQLEPADKRCQFVRLCRTDQEQHADWLPKSLSDDTALQQHQLQHGQPLDALRLLPLQP